MNFQLFHPRALARCKRKFLKSPRRCEISSKISHSDQLIIIFGRKICSLLPLSWLEGFEFLLDLFCHLTLTFSTPALTLPAKTSNAWKPVLDMLLTTWRKVAAHNGTPRLNPNQALLWLLFSFNSMDRADLPSDRTA